MLEGERVSWTGGTVFVIFYFFLLLKGQVTHSMTAHMDAVTGLAIDPHGLYILSGSKTSLFLSSPLTLSFILSPVLSLPPFSLSLSLSLARS